MATDGDTSFVFLIYVDIQWGSSAQIGFNAGDGVRSFTVPGALTSQTLNFETMSNIGVPGVFIYRVNEYPILGLPFGKFHTFRSYQSVEMFAKMYNVLCSVESEVLQLPCLLHHMWQLFTNCTQNISSTCTKRYTQIPCMVS